MDDAIYGEDTIGWRNAAWAMLTPSLPPRAFFSCAAHTFTNLTTTGVRAGCRSCSR